MDSAVRLRHRIVGRLSAVPLVGCKHSCVVDARLYFFFFFLFFFSTGNVPAKYRRSLRGPADPRTPDRPDHLREVVPLRTPDVAECGPIKVRCPDPGFRWGPGGGPAGSGRWFRTPRRGLTGVSRSIPRHSGVNRWKIWGLGRIALVDTYTLEWCSGGTHPAGRETPRHSGRPEPRRGGPKEPETPANEPERDGVVGPAHMGVARTTFGECSEP